METRNQIILTDKIDAREGLNTDAGTIFEVQMAKDTRQCRTTGGWTIVVPRNFAEIDNGDSWQAHEGTRCVYVSSMKVADANGAALFASASKTLAPATEAELHSFEEPGLKAAAQITLTDTGFDLKGITCVDGCIATCVISFAEQTDREWAIATWRSLRPPA